MQSRKRYPKHLSSPLSLSLSLSTCPLPHLKKIPQSIQTIHDVLHKSKVTQFLKIFFLKKAEVNYQLFSHLMQQSKTSYQANENRLIKATKLTSTKISDLKFYTNSNQIKKENITHPQEIEENSICFTSFTIQVSTIFIRR